MDTNAILKHIEEKRDCGVVHLFVIDRSENVSWEQSIIEKSKEIAFFSWHSIWFYRKNKKDTLQQPVSIEEMRPLFKEINDQKTALAILAQLLHKNMANGSESMPIEDAKELAFSFISLFDKDSKYYSNSTWNKNEFTNNKATFDLGLSAWNGLTEATFDSGIIVVDNNKIGIAWFEEED